MSEALLAEGVSIGVSSQTLGKIAFVSATALARRTFTTPLGPGAVARSEADEFWRASIVALDVVGRPADHPDNAKSARPVAIRLHQRA
jgi:hypothetical protein